MYCWLRWFQHVCEQAAWCSASGHFQRKQREVALGCMLQSKVTAFQEWSWTFHDDLWITSEDFLWSTLRLHLSATLVSDHGGGGGLVAKSSPTLGDPMNCSPPGSSVHGILQARMPEWGYYSPSPGDLSLPGIQPGSPAFQADSLPTEPPGKIFKLS